MNGGGDGHVQICFQSRHNFETTFKVGINQLFDLEVAYSSAQYNGKEVNWKLEPLVSFEANFQIPMIPSYSTQFYSFSQILSFFMIKLRTRQVKPTAQADRGIYC